MLKTLDTLGHQATAFAVRRDAQTEEEAASYFGKTGIRFRFFDQPVPKPFLSRKARSLWRSGWELSASEFGRAARQEAASDYDVVLAEQISTARVVEGMSRVVCSLYCLRHVDMRAIGDDRSWMRKFRQWQVRREERSTIAKVGRVRVLSRRLEDLTKTLVPGTRTCVVPLCLDPVLYELVAEPAVPTVGVIGSMFWEPSRAAAIHFMTQIVPRLRKRRPDTNFLVAGWRAQCYLSVLAREAEVELIENFPHPRDVFQRLSVLIYAPPEGTGMKVKVLESMAYGVPVVVNEAGYEGLEADPEPGVRLVSSDNEIVEAVLELLADPAKRSRAVEGGRACLARSFSPEVTTQALVDGLSALTGEPMSSPT
jgi:glycosyltransferase involved in cell wall biosynthesis